jgi:hypothetical protein
MSTQTGPIILSGAFPSRGDAIYVDDETGIEFSPTCAIRMDDAFFSRAVDHLAPLASVAARTVVIKFSPDASTIEIILPDWEILPAEGRALVNGLADGRYRGLALDVTAVEVASTQTDGLREISVLSKATINRIYCNRDEVPQFPLRATSGVPRFR